MRKHCNSQKTSTFTKPALGLCIAETSLQKKALAGTILTSDIDLS